MTDYTRDRDYYGNKISKEKSGCLAAIVNLCIFCVIIGGFVFLKLQCRGEENFDRLNKEMAVSVAPDTISKEDCAAIVKKYMRENLKDPASYESIEIGVADSDEPGSKYVVKHKYRAKNSFGGYVVEQKIIYISETGNVTTVF